MRSVRARLVEDASEACKELGIGGLQGQLAELVTRDAMIGVGPVATAAS
ncbi:hypothetical protein [Streptomyces sp. 3214.6]|nr:hypothetical protein [Streptomyces sp. 3214.6]SHH85971.1 hypothetical protein SAMN05444521_2273 [Streptomyces sp. 3214.6]